MWTLEGRKGSSWLQVRPKLWSEGLDFSVGLFAWLQLIDRQSQNLSAMETGVAWHYRFAEIPVWSVPSQNRLGTAALVRGQKADQNQQLHGDQCRRQR
jgi:hypothetical protein